MNVGGVPWDIKHSSWRSIPNMLDCDDAHCRLVGVLASDQVQFKEKMDMLVGFCWLFLVCSLYIVVLIMRRY